MILFRADGNPALGIGHIMRCLSIADALRENEEEVSFVCADENMKSIICERGYECFVLGTDYHDLDNELDILCGSDFYRKARTIIVDSYYVTERYLEHLSAEKEILYIDDYYSKYPVSGIINYNVFADESEYRRVYGEKLPKLFLGPRYAPLRREFSDCKAIEIKKNVTDILILTGGSDPYNMAFDIASKLLHRKDNTVSYHFVVGAMSSRLEALKEIENLCDFIKVHYNVKDMKSLMENCDIAISAAGSTLYELCACGVPVINYVLADNQLLISESFTKKGIMEFAGDVRKTKDFYDGLFSLIADLSVDYNRRKKLSEAAHNLVDGKGASRLAEIIEKSK